jgi:hypothetical protein
MKAQADSFAEEERIMKILSPEEQADLGAAFESRKRNAQPSMTS